MSSGIAISSIAHKNAAFTMVTFGIVCGPLIGIGNTFVLGKLCGMSALPRVDHGSKFGAGRVALAPVVVASDQEPDADQQQGERQPGKYLAGQHAEWVEGHQNTALAPCAISPASPHAIAANRPIPTATNATVAMKSAAL